MPRFQVALSFAGEQRQYVERVARALQARGIALFYDRFEQLTLWGKDGIEFFHEVFSAESAFVVMFISAEYVAKSWPRHERRAALSRALVEQAECVLPVRFDDTPVPGMPNSIQYEKASNYSPEELAALIAQRIGVPPFTGKASDVPKPQMTSRAGEPVFDYGSFNGRYMLGAGPIEFETMWSKASGESIHLYNDPPSINGIAVAKGARAIHDIGDASAFDFTSRCRTIREGEIAVLRNVHGFYAAVHVLDIKDDTRGDGRDELRFRYVIQGDGSASFSGFAESNGSSDDAEHRESISPVP